MTNWDEWDLEELPDDLMRALLRNAPVVRFGSRVLFGTRGPEVAIPTGMSDGCL